VRNDEARSRGERLGIGPRWPYWDQMFPTKPTSGFIHFKTITTGRHIAQRLWDARETGRATLDERGAGGEHQGLVLYHPDCWWGACAACTWLGPGRGTRAYDEVSAVESHTGALPILTVRWLPPWNRADSDGEFEVLPWVATVDDEAN